MQKIREVGKIEEKVLVATKVLSLSDGGWGEGNGDNAVGKGTGAFRWGVFETSSRPLSKQWLSACCMPGSVPGPEDRCP